jgi:hypothetical protein
MGMGLGALSLANLLDPRDLAAATTDGKVPSGPLTPKAPHFPGKAKSVIHIFAQGAPSHLDTWDYKPSLRRMHGKSISSDGVAMGTPFTFSKYGQSGLEISELFAKTAAHADDLAIVRSMWTDIPAHEVATVFMNTGSLRIAKPSMGSWLVYGLGTMNQNLPGFIALRGGGLPPGGATNYQSAFLPGVFQGTSINTQAPNVPAMIQNIRNVYVSQKEQRRQMDFVHQLNEIHAKNLQRDEALETRLESYEIAFRMQTEALDAFDVNKEPEEVRDAYGRSDQGKQLLIARRLVERGVRYVQVWHGEGQPWDSHDAIGKNHGRLAKECDRAIGALLDDLVALGLLESTLVLWGGEFGRTPTVELPQPGTGITEISGRDHNHHGFSVWMAGGGVKGGTAYGATDELGFKAVEKPVHVHDLQATLLHCLGLDHTRLTFRHSGRDFRLTDIHGRVIEDWLA